MCVVRNGPDREELMQQRAFAHSHTDNKNTLLHHPPVHPDDDTDAKHQKSRQFRTHQDQPRNCSYLLPRVSGCALLLRCWSTRDWVVAAWSSLDFETLERRVVGQVGGCHRQGPWVAKQQCSSTCCGPQAKRSSSTLCRWC